MGGRGPPAFPGVEAGEVSTKCPFSDPAPSATALNPEIKFDTKGVEFGPWIKSFIAQVKYNWVVPYAAMSNKGHVVIEFDVHGDGSITDIAATDPSKIPVFDNAALRAVSESNPLPPLPAEYPTEKAHFIVTFYYNETPES